MSDTEHMDVVELGRYFGYPDCCILNFLGRGMALHMGYMKLASISGKLPLEGTGYVPCPVCRQRSEDELKAEIGNRRQCPLPFPQDGLSKEAVMVAIPVKEEA
jgi:hypothetical protein